MARAPQLPPSWLTGLRSRNVLERKATARRAVGALRSADADFVLERFRSERSPEVYKWLGMALARLGDPRAGRYIRMKLQDCPEGNARDWLWASLAVLTPLAAVGEAEQRLGSGDLVVVLEGAIQAWAARHHSDDLHRLVLDSAAESQSPDVRRWSALALSQHGATVPGSILLDNLGDQDYLLREWSLHVLARQPIPDALPVVRRVVERAATEHARVVEWAVHALAVASPGDPEIDELLIAVRQEATDEGVRDACLAELAGRSGPSATDYVTEVLRTESAALVAVTVLDNLGERLRTSPLSLREQVDHAVFRLRDSAVRALVTEDVFQLDLSQLAMLEAALKDPLARAALRVRLGNSEGGESFRLTDDKRLVVGALVALDEEWEIFRSVLGVPAPAHMSPTTGRTYFVADLEPSASGVSPSIVIAVVGRMGGEAAAVAASQLINEYRPGFVVSIGLSGTLDPEIGLGDVVVADTVTAYLANSRIEDAGDSFSFRPAGEPYRSDKFLADMAAGLRINDPDLYTAWREELTPYSVAAGVELPRLWRGDAASGPSVVASENFKQWLLGLRRNYKAVDMESSGVAAAGWADAVSRSRLLVLRGISDPADASKRRLDAESKGRVRILAMAAATSVMLHVIRMGADVGDLLS